MKTPRELLLERHREAQTRLDAIRRQVLAPMGKNQRESSSMTLRDVLRSLRWHLAGMSAIWIFVLLLHVDSSRAPQTNGLLSRAKIPSPQVIMVSLRNNRRQLFEMIEARPLENGPHELFVPKPRSDRRGDTINT